MRIADFLTFVRVAIIILVVYLILQKYNPWVSILLIIIAMFIDALDGYFALREASNGRLGLFRYIRAVSGNKKDAFYAKSLKSKMSVKPGYGPRLDVAADRIEEYLLWIVFVYLQVLPIYVLIIVVLRHSFVDALMADKGTSSKMNTTVGRIFYTSNASRFLANVLKPLTFSYLILVYVSHWPVQIGYILAAILVAFICIRGLAEVYESFA